MCVCLLSGVDAIVKALARLALCSPADADLPAHVAVFVRPALALAKDHLDTLLPSTWRLLIDLLLRLGCVPLLLPGRG